jgi:hypothetical protein
MALNLAFASIIDIKSIFMLKDKHIINALPLCERQWQCNAVNGFKHKNCITLLQISVTVELH